MSLPPSVTADVPGGALREHRLARAAQHTQASYVSFHPEGFLQRA